MMERARGERAQPGAGKRQSVTCGTIASGIAGFISAPVSSQECMEERVGWLLQFNLTLAHVESVQTGLAVKDDIFPFFLGTVRRD